jgi:hypothetical protein
MAPLLFVYCDRTFTFPKLNNQADFELFGLRYPSAQKVVPIKLFQNLN